MCLCTLSDADESRGKSSLVPKLSLRRHFILDSLFSLKDGFRFRLNLVSSLHFLSPLIQLVSFALYVVGTIEMVASSSVRSDYLGS